MSIDILCVFVRFVLKKSNLRKTWIFLAQEHGEENSFKYNNKTDSTAGWITGNNKSMYESLSRSTKPIASDNSGQVLVSVMLHC